MTVFKKLRFSDRLVRALGGPANRRNKAQLDFADWEVRIVKNGDRGLETYLFFPSSQTKKKLTEKTHASVTVTVVRDRKTRTALRTNQIAGFVTVSAWKRLKRFIQNNLPLKS